MSKDIAIVGFSGRFPQASNTTKYFENLKSGKDSIRPISVKRMQDTSIPVEDNYKSIGYIENIDLFDHEFFNISMAEARSMPPHHRLLLEVVHETFENAAYSLESIKGKRGAVFIGNAMVNYIDLAEKYDPTLFTGNLSSAIAGKIARHFDLRGAALMVDSACSSSLVAVHYACNEILSGASEFALACGMDLSIFLPKMSHHDIGINSPDGKVRSFSADANGTGMGEAVACVMLKPLEKAIADNDNIHCVIKGSAVNQDASLSSSLTAPDSTAQADVIVKSWEKAQINPERITYIEAHGTGTEIGDPIEVKGLNLAFQKFTNRTKFCAIASLKSNIGHAGSAAGIAGLIKMILSFKHKMIFPSLHCENTNPLIDFENSPVYVNTGVKYWEGDENGIRLSGISSFGISGTNCHLVLEEAPPSEDLSPPIKEHYILPISAKNRDSLINYRKALKDFLQDNDEDSLASISNTLTLGRSHFNFRECFIVSGKEELMNRLSSNEALEGHTRNIKATNKLIFTFSDQAEVSRALLQTFCNQYDAFKEACDSLALMSDLDNPKIRKFIFQYAFYSLINHFGVNSNLSIGDGIGKIVISFIKKQISEQEAKTKVESYESSDASNLEERLTTFIKNETTKESVIFAEMGQDGNILNTLKLLTGKQTGFEVVSVQDTKQDALLSFIQDLYLSGFPIKWEPLMIGTGKRTELPLYQFNAERCWLREPSVIPQNKVEDWLYELNWTPDLVKRELYDCTNNVYLVVLDNHQLGEALITKLEELGNTCISLTLSDKYEKVSDTQYAIDASDEKDYQRLSKEIFNNTQLNGIIHLAEHDKLPVLSIDNLEEHLMNGIYSKIYLVKVFSEMLRDKKFRLTFVTANAEKVLPEDDLIAPERSLSAAFLKGLLTEYNRLNFNSIDLDIFDAHISSKAEVVINEIRKNELIPFVSYRNNKRYLPQLTKIDIEDQSENYNDAIEENGVYVLTGGARGIGMAVSSSIAHMKKNNTLVLIGKTNIPERERWEDCISEKENDSETNIINNIKELESKGVRVVYYAADVGNTEDMRTLLGELSRRHERVDGIIHLAGIAGSLAPFTHKSRSEFEQVLKPKVHGTILLDEWAEKLKPKFTVLFSSLNALVPHKNSVAYTMANAFLDAYARKSKHKQYTAINWPGWKEVGMSSGSATVQDDGLKSIKTDDGLKALYLSASIDKSNIAIADVNLSSFLSNPYFLVNLDGKAEAQSINKEKKETHTEAPENLNYSETERKIIGYWQEILESKTIDLDDDFFSLGGHSLNGTQLLNRIEKEFGLEIEFENIFDYPTVRTLAAYINALKNSAQTEKFELIEAQPTQKSYEVTHSQRRLWIIDQMEENQVAYNMIGTYQFDNIEYEILKKAFYSLIERHEILRTTFILINGELKQQVNSIDTVGLEIAYVDLQAKKDIYACAQEVINTETNTPFELDKGPLLRVKLLHLEKEKYVLLFNMHHIVSDAWSMDVLKNELSALYQAYSDGKENPLSPLRIHYKDYAVWQNKELSSENSNKHQEYWLEKFSGELSYLNLPADIPRTMNKTFKGDKCGYLLTKSNSESLEKIARDKGVSMFMLISATVYTLLYRYTQSEDITIGTPIANRVHSDLENQIGFYVNTLALRLQMNGEDKFYEVLERVKKNTLEAYEHQIFPFDKLVDLLNLERDMSKTPLFDVNIVYQTSKSSDNTEEKGGRMIDSYRNILNADPKTSIFDITLDFTWDGHHLLVIAKYNTDVFFRETIERLLLNYESLVTAIVESPTAPIKGLDFLNRNEKNNLLAKQELVYNGNLPSIIDRFDLQVQNSQDKIAVNCGNTNLTYVQLSDEVNRLARFLQSRGIARDHRVAILLDNCEYSIISILGILKCGASFLPLDPKNSTDRLKFIIEDSEAKFLIFHSQYLKEANNLLWESEGLNEYFCIDHDKINSITEDQSQLMNVELWDYVGEAAYDSISAGGWVSSYTGEPFSIEEMDEYRDNSLNKMLPFLTESSRVLEIGCASGITLSAVAPRVDYYLATDMSKNILEYAQSEVGKSGIKNVEFKHTPAHDVHLVNDGKFDIIIINSVIQSFPGLNYLLDVVKKSLDLLSDEGVIFLGDLQDLSKKEALKKDLLEFKKKNRDKGYNIKTDWSNELFISKDFLDDFRDEFDEVKEVIHSEKIGKLRNELTDFRFDCIIRKSKKDQGEVKSPRKKHRYGNEVLNSFSSEAFSNVIDPKSLAYVIYTTGTTGLPKGVEITHENLAHYLENAIACYYPQDTSFASALFTPIFFDLTITSLFCPLVNGGSIAVYNDFDAAQNIQKIFETSSEIDVVKLTPSHITILNDLELSESNVSVVIVGGEALLPTHVDTLQRLNPAIKIFNEYGPTETTVGVTVKQVVDKNHINIGAPLQGNAIYILDENLELLPQGVTGELFVAGQGVAKGYQRRPELAQQKFITNPHSNALGFDRLYKTGDLVRWNAQSELELRGRSDNQVKIRGYRLELEEIEMRLASLDEIEEAVIIVNQNANDHNYLIGYYVSKSGIEADVVRQVLHSLLPAYMIPDYLVALERFPQNRNGKIDRKALMKSSYYKNEQALSNQVLDSYEKRLLNIWQHLLERDNIRTEDNFFEIGGHSLNATRMISHIFKVFKVKIDLRSVFANSTIASLASMIKKLEKEEFSTLEAVPIKPYYEVTNAQNRIWLVSQLDPEMVAYNMPASYLLEGNVNMEAFEHSFRKVIERHEILQTSFITVDGVPKQKINPIETLSAPLLTYIDLRSEENPEEKAKEIALASSNHVFQLEEVPLFKALILQISDEVHLFIFSVHHIIADGWSMGIIIKEMTSLYNAALTKTALQLPTLNIQYKDYSNWLNSQLSGENLIKHRNFWLKKLENEIPVLKLPMVNERPSVKTYNGERASILIEKELKEVVDQFTQQHKATTYMTLLASINILLYKYSGQSDIIIGTPVAGRDHIDLENQVGLYLNTVPIRTSFSGNEKLHEFFLKFIQNIIDTFEHQVYPFDMIVEDLSLNMDRSRNVLFDVGFNFSNESKGEGATFDNLRTQRVDSGYRSVKTDLWFNVEEQNGGISIALDYNKDLFSPVFINEFLSNLKFSLSKLSENENAEIDDLMKLIIENEQITKQEKQTERKKKNISALKNLK